MLDTRALAGALGLRPDTGARGLVDRIVRRIHSMSLAADDIEDIEDIFVRISSDSRLPADRRIYAAMLSRYRKLWYRYTAEETQDL